jgi:hypothetical protein
LQLTARTTHVQPFEVGGASLFHDDRNQQPTGGGAVSATLSPQLAASESGAHALEEQGRAAAASAAAVAAAAAAAAAKERQEPPADFFDNVFDCLIMEDPVFAMDGFTYERRRIEEWLAGNSRSPTTGAELGSTLVVPNHLLRGRIVEWREANGH